MIGAMTPELALTRRNTEINRFYNDTYFQYVLTHNLWHYDADALQSYSLRREGLSATAVGVLRAWMLRFLHERGHSASFIRGRNVNEDYETILAAYPDFASFVPATPLTRREVILAARLEVNHAILRYERKWSADFYWNFYRDLEGRSQNSPVIGPVALRIASRLLTEVGLTDTALWIFARYLFDNEIKTTADALCVPLSRAGYQRLWRRLTALDARVKGYAEDELLRDAIVEAV